jgi:hypothetical protein
MPITITSNKRILRNLLNRDLRGTFGVSVDMILVLLQTTMKVFQNRLIHKGRDYFTDKQFVNNPVFVALMLLIFLFAY